jgi:hypothetical protein
MKKISFLVLMVTLLYNIGLSENDKGKEKSKILEVIDVKTEQKEFECAVTVLLKNHSDKFYEDVVFASKDGRKTLATVLIKPIELQTVEYSSALSCSKYDPATMIYSFKQIKEEGMNFDPSDIPTSVGKNRVGDLEILGWKSYWGKCNECLSPNRLNFEILIKNHSDSIYAGVLFQFGFYDKNNQLIDYWEKLPIQIFLVPNMARTVKVSIAPETQLSNKDIKFIRIGISGFATMQNNDIDEYYPYQNKTDINALEARIPIGYDFEAEKELELERLKEKQQVILDTKKELAAVKSIPYAYQGSLFLNNIYGERTVDIYVKIFEKDHKISQILLKVYNHRDIINFLAYAPQIDFPRYPDKPYPQSGLIICLPSELGMSSPELLKVFPPQYPNTWRECVFHYSPGKCTERPEKFPSISDILSGKAKLCIRVGGHRFTIDNLKKLSQR